MNITLPKIPGTDLEKAAELKKTGLESDYYKHLEQALRPTENAHSSYLFKAKKPESKREQESVGICSDLPDEHCSYVPHRLE